MNLGSPDPLDSFPRLRLRETDGHSRRSSYGGDSELERYCSANSVMETPSTSMSMCSAITVFHDFSDFDFAATKSFDDGNNNTSESLTVAENNRRLRYGSSGLELYGDGGEEFSITALDSLELFAVNRNEDSDRNGNGNENEGEVEEQESEREEDEESMFNYDDGGGGDDDDSENGNEFYLSKSVRFREEPEVRNENSLFVNSSIAFGSNDFDDFSSRTENSLLMNSSVAFGSNDLDDFMLQNDTVSVMSDIFHNPKEKENHRVEEEGMDEKDEVRIDEEVEETDDVGDFGDKLVACTEIYSVSEVYEEEAPQKNLNVIDGGSEVKENRDLEVIDGGSEVKANRDINNEAIIPSSDDASQCMNPELGDSKFKFDDFCDSRVDQSSSNPSVHVGNVNAKSFENFEKVVPPLNSGMRKTLESSSTSTNVVEKSTVMSKIEDFELNEFYDEVVQEMEEILLDSVDSPGARLAMGNRLLEPQFSMPLRDGGLTASTSSTDDAYLLVQRPRINRIEVIGARQKKGDVSFSERLVGVKEYTVYKIKVWSGKDQWEIERRYRDFLTLYHCVKALFHEQGWILPLPWSSVEKESKIFRSASPDIIAKRSVLIQECLQSILSTRFFSSPPRALIWFLSPQDSLRISPASNAPESQSPFTREDHITRNFSTLGKTISLIVEITSNKSMRQLLEAQHHTCAGCHKHFDDGKTLIWDFVQTFGWGKPRICEYTGQLFCSSCHTNETAVLPARVLHQWDFSHYPVSQMAKSYLDSIHEQPMLCVTAVNPFLLSKVPALLHVMSVRKKIGIMLTYVRCPFRRSINRGLGNRRYLLESNDFFSLRDLIDLSKGVFAALPVMVETVSRKILEHITDQCLICCDVGVPCSARQDCSDPSSLIFPFQEDDIERCKACRLVFHKRCYRKLSNCPCGLQLRLNETRSLTNRASQRGSGETKGALDLLGRGLSLSSGLPPRFLSGLFTKEKPEKTREHKDQNIILMGSLPSTSL